MSILTRKLLRMVRTNRGQFIALVLIVMLGVSIYISMNTAQSNLGLSQERFYQEYRFADYTFAVVKAPESVVNRIEAVPGAAVRRAEAVRRIEAIPTTRSAAVVPARTAFATRNFIGSGGPLGPAGSAVVVAPAAVAAGVGVVAAVGAAS